MQSARCLGFSVDRAAAPGASELYNKFLNGAETAPCESQTALNDLENFTRNNLLPSPGARCPGRACGPSYSRSIGPQPQGSSNYKHRNLTNPERLTATPKQLSNNNQNSPRSHRLDPAGARHPGRALGPSASQSIAPQPQGRPNYKHTKLPNGFGAASCKSHTACRQSGQLPRKSPRYAPREPGVQAQLPDSLEPGQIAPQPLNGSL